jgi:hypothetical protein
MGSTRLFNGWNMNEKFRIHSISGIPWLLSKSVNMTKFYFMHSQANYAFKAHIVPSQDWNYQSISVLPRHHFMGMT